MPHQHHLELENLLQFLDESPNAWHAVENIQKILQLHGFKRVHESERWSLTPGERYYVERNGSSLCAFIAPTTSLESIQLVASHTDSPGFKLKPQAEYRKENMILLGLEVYGGPLLNSWLNRDLGIAGRVVFLDENKTIKQMLVRLDRYPVVIPQLAIHLDRKINDEGLLLNKQDHLAAFAGFVDDNQTSETFLQRQISACLGKKADLLSTDLMLFPIEKAAFIGDQHSLIASYRIDSLVSVYAGLMALCQAEPSSRVLKMVAFCDHEEVGSATAQGAASTFVNHTLERVGFAFNLSREDFMRCLRSSLCVSLDLAHALHPNYSDRHEPRHTNLMQKGIAIKYNAQQRYASDALSAATMVALCKQLDIPYQHFVTRGDMPCGSTIGPIHAQITGMPTVDIGTPQLSMHSCRELTACQDVIDTIRLLTGFFSKNSAVTQA